MAVFNYLRKEIDAKIVYYGPGISGKTTNLQFIHQNLKPEQRGKMVSLETDEDRTLFFDFLPIELESVRGFKTRFHLYTVPGQVYYGATRRAVLTGADGVIFVADSQADRLEDNLYSIKDLEDNLRYYGKNIEMIPLIVQYNKRDLPHILSMEELNQKINGMNAPFFEAVAVRGNGVFESLTMACRLVLKAIEAGVEARRTSMMSEKASPASAVKTPRPEKNFPRPEPNTGMGHTPLPNRGLRIEQEIPRPEPVPTAAMATGVLTRPLQAEKEASFLKTPANGLRLEKDNSPSKVPHPAAPAPQEAEAKAEEESRKAESRTIFSRVFDKKKPQPVLRMEEEKGEKIPVPKEKLKILSCGQPRVSSPSRLEIPLTLEIDGPGKIYAFNLSINLEQLDPKVE